MMNDKMPKMSGKRDFSEIENDSNERIIDNSNESEKIRHQKTRFLANLIRKYLLTRQHNSNEIIKW